jgi:hypothetical protein
MATGLFLGTGQTGTVPNGAPYIVMTRHQALATGRITQIKVYSGVAGNVKVCVYADSSGEPTGFLGGNNSGVTVAVGWNTITLTQSADVVLNSWYWIAFLMDTAGAVNALSTTGYVRRYKSWTYATGLPDPAGTGYTSESNLYMDCIDGYGVLVLTPSSISHPVSYGSPEVLILALAIQPSSIVQVVAIGTPVLLYPQTVLPSSIVQPIAVCMPWLGTFGFVKPQSIAQQISIGSPTLYKYVWHVVLDGQYATETPRINRTYIIGRDQYGNPVYGSAIESSEVDLVGERLDFQQEVAIPTESQAASMASAILGKMRLTKSRGVILIPPNCGQELFDVVQILDSAANQQVFKFRVVGIRFEYNPKQSRYQHNLILSSV